MKFLDFNLENYHTLLRQLQGLYNICNFQNYREATEPLVVLRHDIDVCLESALKIAEIDSEFGVSSAFFMLHSSPFYNLLSSETVEVVKKISGLGHEIGFHYDCSLFGLVKDKKGLLIKMIDVFEMLCEVKVTSIACHNLSLTSEDYFSGISEYINAYPLAIKENMLYLSDSTAVWRKGALEKLFTPSPKVQLLLHPLYWNREKYQGRKQILEDFESKKTKQLKRYFNMWEDVWDAYLTKYEGLLETK